MVKTWNFLQPGDQIMLHANQSQPRLTRRLDERELLEGTLVQSERVRILIVFGPLAFAPELCCSLGFDI